MKKHARNVARMVRFVAAFVIVSFVLHHLPAIVGIRIPADDYFRKRAVTLLGEENGFCSGEQVRAPSGKDYILSAWHCKDLARDGIITVRTEDGQMLKRKVITIDDNSDLMLIEGLPNLPGLSIAKEHGKHDHVKTFTHGGGLDTWRSDGELIMDKQITVEVPVSIKDCTGAKLRPIEMFSLFGKYQTCAMVVIETGTTAKIIPGSSGGMVVNDAGELVGVVSAGDGYGIGWLVRLIDVQAFMLDK